MILSREAMDYILAHNLDRISIQEGIENVVKQVETTLNGMSNLPMELSCTPQADTTTQPNKSVDLHWIQQNMSNKSYPCNHPSDKGRHVFACSGCQCLPSPWVFELVHDSEEASLQMKCIYSGQVGSVSLTSYESKVEQKEQAPSNFDEWMMTHGPGCWHDIHLGKYVPFYSLCNFSFLIESKWKEPHMQERMEFLNQVCEARQANPVIRNGLNLALVPDQ
jgi:hypothetical protein